MRRLLLALLLATVCGQGGSASADALTAATVAVQAVEPTADGKARVAECTGVLIAPDLVLTAGHCLDGVDRPAHVAAFAYENGAPKSPHLAVAAFARHPDHVTGWRQRPGDPASRQREISADIALIRLARPLAGATVAGLAPDPYAAASGRAAIAGTGRASAARDARSGRMKNLSASAVRLTTGGAPRVAFATVGAAVCGGDSGGPAATTDGAVWGVVSAILQAKGGCGTRIVIVPVDAASDGFKRMKADVGAR